jgi:thioesterase domain-containing protein
MKFSIAEQVTQEIITGIPLAKAMGLKLKSYHSSSLTYQIPIEPNINVHQTAFAGSISTLMILTGWAWLNIRLRESAQDASVVLAQHQTKFIAPIKREFSAMCLAPENTLWCNFSNQLQHRGRARIELKVLVEVDQRCAAEFVGSYVARMEDFSPS